MLAMTAVGQNHGPLPTSAADAVLKASAPVPEGAQRVRGIEFDRFEGRDITVDEMVAGMAGMGFQASAVSEAVRIINDMVGGFFSHSTYELTKISHLSEFAKTPKTHRPGPRFS